MCYCIMRNFTSLFRKSVKKKKNLIIGTEEVKANQLKAASIGSRKRRSNHGQPFDSAVNSI